MIWTLVLLVLATNPLKNQMENVDDEIVSVAFGLENDHLENLPV